MFQGFLNLNASFTGSPSLFSGINAFPNCVSGCDEEPILESWYDHACDFLPSI